MSKLAGPCHPKVESTVKYLGMEVDDAHAIAEQIDVGNTGAGIHHEREGEAGVAMALSITPRENHATNLVELCDELRLAAGLGTQHDELRLETLFGCRTKAWRSKATTCRMTARPKATH
jgi:hypothetical protein